MMAGQGTLLALARVRARPAPAGCGPRGRRRSGSSSLVKLALPWGPAMPWSLSDVDRDASPMHGAAAPSAAPAGTAGPAARCARLAAGWPALAIVWALGAAFVLARARSRRAARRARCAAAALAPLAARRRIASRDAALVVGRRERRSARRRRRSPRDHRRPARAARRSGAAARRAAPRARARAPPRCARPARPDRRRRADVVVAGRPRSSQRRLDLAREAACDAWALEAGDATAPAYARLLVRMAALRAPPRRRSPPITRSTRASPPCSAPPAPHADRHAARARARRVVRARARRRSQRSGARPAESARYTPQMAQALLRRVSRGRPRRRRPLSRDEACELQAELRRQKTEL